MAARDTLAEWLDDFDVVEEDHDGFRVLCPCHDDSEPSLRLTVGDTGKVLVKCRVGCRTEDVLAALGLTFAELNRMKPGQIGTRAHSRTDVPASDLDLARLHRKLARYAAELLSTPEGRVDALPYAERRFGVTEADAERLGLGYTEELDGTPRLVVPFRDRDGVARGFQGRALDNSNPRWSGPRAPKGASWSKVAWFEGTTGFDAVLICEGPGDALTASCALGYDAIGIPGAGNADNVTEAVAELLDGREAVLAGDGDRAGRKFSATIAHALADRGLTVRILDIPDGEDLSSWREADPDGFYDVATQAIHAAEAIHSNAATMLLWDEKEYSLTDLGGARYLRDFMELSGSGVRYTEEAGFYVLKDGVWRRDHHQEVRSRAQDVADVVRKLAAAATEEAERDGASEYEKKRANRFRQFAAHVQSSRGLDAIIRELQAVKGVPASIADFDRHPDLLAVKNGVVNLRTGVLSPPDPSLMLSRRVNFDYDPAAACPQWEACMADWFRAYPDIPGYMRRLVGYGITGHADEECFVVHWGRGGNGKSVYLRVLSDIFAEYTTTTPFQTFESRPSGGGIPNDLAALKGARLVVASEGERSKPMAEAILKRVTGRDNVSARFLHKEFFEFRPEFLLMLATNHKPKFKSQDDGLWRRIKLIHWARQYRAEERRAGLDRILLEEAEGILAWAVAGAREWYSGGLKDPDSIREATREYRNSEDALGGFLPGVYVPDPDAEEVDGGQLFLDYCTWADDENLPRHEVWRRATFWDALVERGYTRHDRPGGCTFSGIRHSRRPAPKKAPAPVEEAPAPEKEANTMHGTTNGPSLDDII